MMMTFSNMNNEALQVQTKAIPEMFVMKRDGDKNPVANCRDLSEGERAREIEIECHRSITSLRYEN